MSEEKEQAVIGHRLEHIDEWHTKIINKNGEFIMRTISQKSEAFLERLKEKERSKGRRARY